MAAPAYTAVVMVGYNTIRHQRLWSEAELRSFVIQEIRRPRYRRTLFVVDAAGHEVLACELGTPDEYS